MFCAAQEKHEFCEDKCMQNCINLTLSQFGTFPGIWHKIKSLTINILLDTDQAHSALFLANKRHYAITNLHKAETIFFLFSMKDILRRLQLWCIYLKFDKHVTSRGNDHTRWNRIVQCAYLPFRLQHETFIKRLLPNMNTCVFLNAALGVTFWHFERNLQFCRQLNGILTLILICVHYCLYVRQQHSQLLIKFKVLPSRAMDLI